MKKNYLKTEYKDKGIGSWRSLYLQFLQYGVLANMQSIIELGAGSPDFLIKTSLNKKMAVDADNLYAEKFENYGINFILANLDDRESLNGLGPFDIIVCSDVFEHLACPQNLLANISEIVSPKGVLFSHVPNEFSLKKQCR
jgi:SAM-dependent methyltransferase